MSKEFKLFLMILLILASGYLSNKIIITGKFHILEEKTNTELMVLSDPSGAEVYFGWNYAGNTPVILTNLNPGNHQVVLKKIGYYDLTGSIDLKKDQRRDVFFELKPNTGRFYIETDPKGANVYVDGIHRGRTPKLVNDLSDGTHIIKITKEFYNDYVNFVTVNKDREERVFIKLQTKTKQ